MFWVAVIWGRHNANRYMTFGLKPGSRPSQGSGSRAPLFVSTVLLVVVINILVLENAPRLMPAKLCLVPTNPYPWAPAKVAGHDNSTGMRR
jgi:hypothetical protein